MNQQAYGTCGKCGKQVTGMGHLADCYVMKIEVQNEALSAKLEVAVKALSALSNGAGSDKLEYVGIAREALLQITERIEK